MLEIRHEPTAPTRTLRLASGDKIDAHRHDSQIVNAGRGVSAVTTDQGSWVAPATAPSFGRRLTTLAVVAAAVYYIYDKITDRRAKALQVTVDVQEANFEMTAQITNNSAQAIHYVRAELVKRSFYDTYSGKYSTPLPV
jgi:hypothetical protein